MSITVKELIKILKRLPREAIVNIHSKYPITLEEEWTFTPLVWDEIRVKVDNEVMRASEFYYLLGGRPSYTIKDSEEEEHSYSRADIENIIIG